MFVKLSMDGKNGGGKSFTTAMLAAGLSKEFCGSRPVLMFDSEGRGPLLKALIYDVEKVPLTIVSGTSLVALLDALDRAHKDKAAVFVGDQLTSPWLEGLAAFSFGDGELSFAQRQQLMNQWETMVRRFKGPFHALACGRLGYQWENVEDPETGRMKLMQGDSKFNAGGGSNFGYECELELEIRRKKNLIGGLLRRKTAVQHICSVVKDVTTMLTGEEFVFQAIKGGYKRGGYSAVLDALRPHIEFMQKLEGGGFEAGESSKKLLVSGKTAWARDNADRKGLLEDLAANLEMCFPAGEGRSKLAKMFRDLTLEYLNGFISWSRMEEETPTDDLGKNLLIVKAVRKRVEAGEIPTTQQSLIALLDLANDDVFAPPAKARTLLEAMGLQSITEAEAKPNGKAKRAKAQPVVDAIDGGENEAAS